MGEPSYCGACRPEEPLGDLKMAPKAWAPILEHPNVKGRSVVPDWLAGSVSFCRECGLLLDLHFDKHMGWYETRALALAVLPLFTNKAEVDIMVRLVIEKHVTWGDAAWRMIEVHLRQDDYALEEAAEVILAGLGDSRIGPRAAGQLARMVNQVILRGCDQGTTVKADLKPLVRAAEDDALYMNLDPTGRAQARRVVQDSLRGILARVEEGVRAGAAEPDWDACARIEAAAGRGSRIQRSLARIESALGLFSGVDVDVLLEEGTALEDLVAEEALAPKEIKVLERAYERLRAMDAQRYEDDWGGPLSAGLGRYRHLIASAKGVSPQPPVPTARRKRPRKLSQRPAGETFILYGFFITMMTFALIAACFSAAFTLQRLAAGDAAVSIVGGGLTAVLVWACVLLRRRAKS